MDRTTARTIHEAGERLERCTVQPHRDFTTAVQALLAARDTGALPDDLETEVQRVLDQVPGIGASLERAARVVGDLPRRLITQTAHYMS